MRCIDWLGHGLSDCTWWQVVLYTLVTTHITIAAVTIFLHRAQAHRALDLHADPVALLPLLALADHRHGDQGVGRDPPQAPRQVRDRRRPAQPADARHRRPCCWRGSELYRTEAKNQETLAKFGHGTPDDWIERNLYTRYSWQGVGLMLIINLAAVRRASALTVWAVQMLWIPITAAGIINGIGHYWGYRNFEAPDASRNILPWGIDHRRRRAAQQPPHLPDLGQAVGQAVRVRHRLGLHPRAADARPGQGAQDRRRSCKLGAIKPVADDKTLEAVIANRYEVMASYARELRRACARRAGQR